MSTAPAASRKTVKRRHRDHELRTLTVPAAPGITHYPHSPAQPTAPSFNPASMRSQSSARTPYQSTVRPLRTLQIPKSHDF